MKQLKLAVIALIAFVAVGNISAQDENNRWAISAGVNAIDFYPIPTGAGVKDMLDMNDWNILPTISRITVERYFDKGFSLQLAGSMNKIEFMDAPNDSDFLYWSIDAAVKYDLNTLIGETGWFDPYLLLGGSFVSWGDQEGAVLNYGAGYNAWFNDNVGLNFQMSTKRIRNQNQNVRSHYQTSIGLIVKFGGKDTDGDEVYDKDDACPEVAGLKEFNGCPDADGDGVKDSDDACPNTAGLAAMNGCPDSDGDGVADKDDMCINEKGTKANKGCPDSDGDGVIDKDDNCASVSGNAENGGCPWPDTDGDGILDKDDKCINEAGSASDNGCPVISYAAKLGVNTFAQNILFNTGKASFKSGVTVVLEGMLELLNEYPKAEFAVRGYTDSTGSDALNLNLSDKRANAVRNFLINNGIDASRLTVKGFGEENPVAPNNTSAGREQNRRVEVKVTN
ncbi:MAG: OOP family OmpA-OmpF porin [Polaribacter sp.]|jgi:OOP family OmpA-OmpF porin